VSLSPSLLLQSIGYEPVVAVVLEGEQELDVLTLVVVKILAGEEVKAHGFIQI